MNTRLRPHDGLPGHWNTTGERPLSPAGLLALLLVGVVGCLGAAELVLKLYALS
ncbi:hypothetical protein [Zoogloea sp.]|uniref:hypothetical protein n=1 Tax=Zoogloea sp. TaxID=49181 RepID=UPI0035B33F69